MTPSANHISETITRFLDGACDEWEWDDFTSAPIREAFLEGIRLVCIGIRDAFPPPAGSAAYCSKEGMDFLRVIALHLKSAT